MFKGLFFALVVTFGSFANAAIEISSTVNVRSAYVWHGVSDSDSATIDGSLDYSNDLGIVSGIWATSYSTTDDATNDRDQSNEVDLYLGYTHKFSEEFSLTALYTFFGYVSDSKSNFDEISLNAAYKNFNLFYGYYREYQGADSDGQVHYIRGSSTLEINELHSAGFAVGYSLIDEETAVGFDSYVDVLIGLYRKVDGFKVGMELTDTDRKDAANNELKDRKVAFILNRTF